MTSLLRVENKQLLDRLLNVINKREGHLLAIDVEQAKIDLTTHSSANIDLDYVESKLNVDLTINQLHDAIQTEVNNIKKKALMTIADAGIKYTDITKVFMTGGTTAIPMVRQTITDLFPNTDIVDGDKFGSVGLGLAIDASRKFG